MKRRDFITVLAGAAAWPLTAHAQQPERMRRIGVLMSTGADNADSQARLGAFLQGLQEFGWAVGRNLRIDIRWGAGDPDRHRQYAARQNRPVRSHRLHGAVARGGGYSSQCCAIPTTLSASLEDSRAPRMPA